MVKRILFVDDEPQVLESMRQLLERTEYECLLAENSDNALALLAENPVGMIICDMSMPGMNGRQLLRRIKDLYPGTLRVLLTGYTEEHENLNALREGTANLCIFKPWDNEQMLSVIQRLFDTLDKMMSRNVLSSVSRVSSLPSVSGVYSRVCAIINEEGDMDKVVAAIAADQSIAAKVLQVINSSFYSVKTGSLKQAAVFLGYINIRSIVLATNLLSFSDNSPVQDKLLYRLWQHSGLANQILQTLYVEVFQKKPPEIAATAGLLHDIGRVFLLMNQGESYREMIQAKRLWGRSSLCDAEREAYYVSHDEVGGYLLNWWGFPYALVEAAVYHHHPLDSRVIHREIVCMTHLAHVYSWSVLTAGAKEVQQEFDSDVFSFLGVSKDFCDRVVERSRLQY
ncbi:MAG TPA: HDOD domain-containing protein [Patescibacteria group bacterium]|nr:HDOD domain-containing protein [Patescibacteria group bacterium]